MAEDVAVPHVLMPEVVQDIYGWGGQCTAGRRVDLRESLSVAVSIGIAGFRGRMLSGTAKGTLGRVALNATIVSSRGDILTVSFQPSSLASGSLMNPSQPTRLINLYFKQMEMDGMCVHAIMGEFPDLDLIVRRDLRGRINVVLESEGCNRGVGERHFQPQLGAHSSVIIKGSAHLVVDGLRLHGEFVLYRCH